MTDPRDTALADREQAQRARMDAAHQQATAARTEPCGRALHPWATPYVSTPCGRPHGHDGDCWPTALREDREGYGMTYNAECDGCGITAADLPHEEMGLSLDEASERWFEPIHLSGGRLLCQGCANEGRRTTP